MKQPRGASITCIVMEVYRTLLTKNSKEGFLCLILGFLLVYGWSIVSLNGIASFKLTLTHTHSLSLSLSLPPPTSLCMCMCVCARLYLCFCSRVIFSFLRILHIDLHSGWTSLQSYNSELKTQFSTQEEENITGTGSLAKYSVLMKL